MDTNKNIDQNNKNINNINMPTELIEPKQILLDKNFLNILIKENLIKFPNVVIKAEYPINGTRYIITGIDKKLFKDCNLIKTIVIEENIEIIEEKTFKNCNNLEKIKLPNSIKIISKNAFENCVNLQSISTSNSTSNNELPKNIDKIGKEAFKNCTSLKNLHIPSEITKIAKNAFEGIKYIYYKGIAEGSPWGAIKNLSIGV